MSHASLEFASPVVDVVFPMSFSDAAECVRVCHSSVRGGSVALSKSDLGHLRLMSTAYKPKGLS